MTKFIPECTKLQHLIFSRSSMLALTFSLHKGLEVKVSNPPLAFGTGFSKVNYFFFKWKLLKSRETVRKWECPENVCNPDDFTHQHDCCQ